MKSASSIGFSILNLQSRCERSLAAWLVRIGVLLSALGSSALLLTSAALVHGSPVQAERTPGKQALPPLVQTFLNQNCVSCHNKQTASGGLNLAAQGFNPAEPANHAFWVKLHDRVSAGEM